MYIISANKWLSEIGQGKFNVDALLVEVEDAIIIHAVVSTKWVGLSREVERTLITMFQCGNRYSSIYKTNIKIPLISINYCNRF